MALRVGRPLCLWGKEGKDEDESISADIDRGQWSQEAVPDFGTLRLPAMPFVFEAGEPWSAKQTAAEKDYNCTLVIKKELSSMTKPDAEHVLLIQV